MPIRIAAIYSAPVKSLALQRHERADVGKHGIAGDRAFFVVDHRDRMVSQREYSALTRVRAAFDPAADALTLAFPDGSEVGGAPKDASPVTSRFFGHRDVEGTLVEGGWSEALSEFCGAPLRLVRSRGNSFDALPMSILSSASIDALRAASGEPSFEERRFRPNVYVTGIEAPHGEDAWVGGEVRIGAGVVVRVILRDPRCVMTTQNPDTGVHDFDTLNLIATYRTDQPKEVNFGVYGAVVSVGTIAIGDEIAPA